MREIKFRAWDKNNKKMISIARFDFADWSVYTHLFGEPTDGINCEIMQYTGLQDKNGKEIYEGDILDCGDRIVKVKWNNPCGQWDCDFVKYQGKKSSNGIENAEWQYRADAIGNIYENPELLEVI